MTPAVVLVGPPGSGKTSVGRAVAALLGVDFLDTDDAVERADGRSVQQIFADDGEAVFRRIESRAVASALREHPGVLALGGGSISVASTRTLLLDHHVVLLDASVPAMLRRIGDDSTRPLLVGDVEERLETLATARRAWYREVASLTVSTDRLDVSGVADLVLEAVTAGLGRARWESARARGRG